MNRRTLTAIVLAYLIPGAGHFYLGRRARAIAFFCIVVSMFALGIALDGDLYTLVRSGRALLRILASLGSIGAGIPYFIAAWKGVHGDVTSITYEHGTAFTITAGLMNLLLILDAFDIARGRKQ
jgi:TM2 domain-containing membrane protein YozV